MKDATSPPQIDTHLRLFLFCLLLGSYLLVYVPYLDSIDGDAILAVSTSLVRHGSFDIGVIGAQDSLLLFDKARMGSFGLDGALYSKKGVTPSLALLPLVALSELIPWLDTRATAMLFNPLVTAGTAVVLYSLVRRLGYRPRTGLIVALIYGLASLPLNYVKTLYGEPLAALLLLVSVDAVVRYRGSTIHVGTRYISSLALAGLCVGLLIGVNMVYGMMVPIIAISIMLIAPKGTQRTRYSLSLRNVITFGLPVVGVVCLLGIYNWARFGNPLTTGYGFSVGEGFTTPFWRGFIGLTISPFRGIAWYSPVLLLGIPGWLMLRRRINWLAWLTLMLVGLQIILFSLWSSWEGGVVWGPRFLIPVIPLMALWLAPLVEATWANETIRTRTISSLHPRRFLSVVIVAFAALSTVIQVLGVAFNIFTFNGYLFSRYYDLNTQGFSATVVTDLGASPIIGHLWLALKGYPLEPVWIVNVDWLHLGVAFFLVLTGVFMLRTRRSVSLPIVTIGIILIALNVVAARQQRGEAYERITALNSTLNPPGTVVVASTGLGQSLLDMKGRNRIISTNAPTEPDDLRARGLWNDALKQGGNLWLVTWFPPGSPENWQERDLWDNASLGLERNAAGHRALLFNLTPPPMPEREAGYSFGSFHLNRYGVEFVDEGVLVSLEWSAEGEATEDYSWFVHLIDSNGNILAQQDRQPNLPTSVWSPSEPVIDRLFFPLNLHEGLRLRIGWLDPANGERLPVTDSAGQQLPDGFAILPLDE